MPKTSKIIALGILGVMMLILVFSSWNDTATFDEIAHIPAGYSYLTQKDYRLNPEHPPLAKDLSAVPLLFLNLNFPTNVPEWTEEINGQWGMGRIFLYEAGNDANQILHWSRFPTMLLALLLGWLLFKWVSSLYGYKVGLLTLFFYAFSPTIIAHSRYVTTEAGTALGVFIVIASFVNFLAKPTKKNIVIAGISFGLAQLFKFSLVTLAPYIFVLAILWAFLNKENGFWKTFLPVLYKTVLIGLIGVLVIWIVYSYHVWNYPQEHQIQTIESVVGHFALQPFVKLAIWMSGIKFLQPLGQYLFGLLMMTQRASGGNTAYFLGSVSSQGTPLYFPLLYLVKESLVFHFFTLIAIIFSIMNVVKAREKNIRAVKEWMQGNFAQTACIIFIVYYLTMSITGNLNIGIRHIIPILPFIYFLVARQIVRWVKRHDIEEPQNFLQIFNYLYHSYLQPIKNYSLVIALCLLMFLTTLMVAPYYLSYYNILGGGIDNGYKIATDSNYDWGQDFGRLVSFVERNGIKKIAIDYFGGANPQYYLGDKFIPWWSAKGQPEPGTWLAVSVNTYQGAIATPKGDFHREERDNYSWLKDKKPIARAGKSIFIYKF